VTKNKNHYNIVVCKNDVYVYVLEDLDTLYCNDNNCCWSKENKVTICKKYKQRKEYWIICWHITTLHNIILGQLKGSLLKNLYGCKNFGICS